MTSRVIGLRPLMRSDRFAPGVRDLDARHLDRRPAELLDFYRRDARIALLTKELLGRIKDALSGAFSGAWHRSAS